MPKRGSQWCVDKKQFKIKWLQTIYKVKITSTQKRIPRQIEKINLISGIKLCIAIAKYRGPVFDIMHRGITVFAETFRSIFCWDISVICLTVVSKLAVTVFISLYFQTFWPKILHFLGHFKNVSVYDRKKSRGARALDQKLYIWKITNCAVLWTHFLRFCLGP